MDRKQLLARMFKERMKEAPIDVEIEVEDDENEGMDTDGEAPEMALEEADDELPSLREQMNEEPLMGGPAGEGEDEMMLDDDQFAAELEQGGRTTPLRARVLEALRMKKKG